MINLKSTTLLFLSVLAITLLSCNKSNIAKADKFYEQDNVPEAIKYYELAIAEGDTTAMNKLALLYANEHQPEKQKQFTLVLLKREICLQRNIWQT